MAHLRCPTNPSPNQLKNEPQGEGERSNAPTVYNGKLCYETFSYLHVSRPPIRL